MDPNNVPTNHREVPPSHFDVDSPEGRRTPAAPPLGRRALLSAAGLAGAFALTRFVPAREASAHARPDPSTMIPGAAARSLAQSALESRIDGLERKIASTPDGICEPRIPITTLPSSMGAQYVISSPGAYYLPCNLTQKSRKVCIDIRADHVDIDGQGFVFVGGGRGASSCIRASGRTAIEIRNCAFKGWRGACCDMVDCDDVYVRDVVIHGCSIPARGCAAIRCRDRSCIEDCRFVRVRGDVLVAGARSLVSDCGMHECEGQAVSTGPGSIIARCECAGGSGGAFRSAEECRIESCTVMRRDARAIECGDRSSVIGNRVLFCWGISCGPESCCIDNELSSCGGGPDGPEGPGAAIVLTGSRSVCRRNSISSSRIGISVHRDGTSCHVHENVVLDAGAGFDSKSAPTGGIVIHDSAAGCVCTCNHVGALPGVTPYILGGSVHGPVARVSSGDISFVRSASHHLVNTAT
jgi:hypothetical protein